MSSGDRYDYDDIIHLPHHISSIHPQMPRISRAAQFSPFAALTGYDAVIRETGRMTDRQIELSEDQLAVLDRKLQFLLKNHKAEHEISVTCFVPDEKKTGGAYITVAGQIKGVDGYRRVITMMDGTKIPLDNVLELESDLFLGAFADLII